MSAFGSSSINKSGKIVVPKAPPRRRPPPSSTRTATEAKAASNVATRSTSQASKDGTPQTHSGPPRATPGDAEELRETRRATRGHKQTTLRDSTASSSHTAETTTLPRTSTRSASSLKATSQPPITTSQTVSAQPSSPIEDYENPNEQLRREIEATVSKNPKGKSTGISVIATPSEVDTELVAGTKLNKSRTRGVRGGTSRANVEESSSNVDLDSSRLTGTSSLAEKGKRRPKESSLVKSATPSEKPSQPVDEDEVESILTEADSTTIKKRRRLNTPDGYEDVTIVPSMVTMFELSSRRSRIGKLSEREKKMRQIDWDAVHTRRKEDENRMAFSKGTRVTLPKDDRENDSEEDGDEEDIDAQIAKAARGNRGSRQGIQIRVVNGEHLVDPESQKVDRHALANQDMETLEEFEEDDLTKKFNSHTYIHMKRRDPVERIPSKDKWSFADTDKFYQCLSQFGTDFLIISRMFPGRSRRHIKAKFIREERSDPDRVKRALVGEERQAWDLDAYKHATGLGEDDFRDPRQVEDELRQRREEREQEIEAQKRKTEELQRQKRLAGHVDENDEYDEENANGTGALNEEILEVIDE